MREEVLLKVTETLGLERTGWPVTRGVPLPKGALQDLENVGVEDAGGEVVPAQFRVLSRWTDGSLKWVLADFQADVPAGGEAAYRFVYGGDIGKAEHDAAVRVDEGADRISICTGPLRFEVNRERFSFLENVALLQGGAWVEASSSGGEARVRICESLQGNGKRYVYGMGGDCLASLAVDGYQVEVEEVGPVRVVIRCEGAFEADVPMHHYSGYRPFRFVTRIYAYAGRAELRVLHTVIVRCNPRETEVEEIAVRIPVALSGPVRYRVASRRAEEGALADGDSLMLSQWLHNHFRVDRRSGERVQVLAEGERTEGWMAVEDGRVGVAVGLRYMPEEFPKALGASGEGIDVYCWRDPDGGRLSMKRYGEAVAWDEGEGVYADGTGTAKTSEFFICYYGVDEGEVVQDRVRGWLQVPHVCLDPAWAAACEVTGGFLPSDVERFPESERMMTGFLDWLERNIRLGGWYGFFDWGDALVSWDPEMGDWKFTGRWGWCNSEWDPRHGVWIQYLRTGDARYFQLGEAMTRHSMDVDTCHDHPFRPYMVGGCFRHSVDHFGDEPCASHTFLDNWIDYYYLTGDLRTFEVLQEAGAFFMRYRWTEDPTFSFSLRSIANTFRGLLHVYDVTGDSKFLERAEVVYEVIARGQNEDGSWHKRFQVSTPDRLPNQAPFGMATEGTTLAVEMGSATPFTDAEFQKLRGDNRPLIRVVPPEDQKGYQTHYLMVGLELFHRLTGREDVAQVYRRAVDWFCGYPRILHAEFAIQQRYGGIVCRHLGYAYRMSGDRNYLEIGRKVLRRLIRDQDQGDDPKQRGAVGLSPMFISLLFWGVPYLLGAMDEAGLRESEEV